jgi:hypothetical protein
MRSLEVAPAMNDLLQVLECLQRHRSNPFHFSGLMDKMIKFHPNLEDEPLDVKLLSPFFRAAYASFLQPSLITLIKRIKSLHQQDQIFNLALKANMSRVAKYVIELRRANPRSMDKFQKLAFQKNNEEVVSSLLALSCQPSKCAINAAFQKGQVDICRALITHKVPLPEDVCDHMNMSQGMEEIVMLLLRQGSRVSCAAMTRAVRQRNITAVIALSQGFRQSGNGGVAIPKDSAEPVVVAMETSFLFAVQHLLEQGWPLPEPASLLASLIKCEFKEDIFLAVFSHVRILNKKALAHQPPLPCYQLPVKETGEHILTFGRLGILNALIESKAIKLSDNWANNVQKRGACDVSDFLLTKFASSLVK